VIPGYSGEEHHASAMALLIDGVLGPVIRLLGLKRALQVGGWRTRST